MGAEQSDCYKILGIDDVIYGPVELPTLVTWVHQQRVTAQTWIYVIGTDEWVKAERMPELTMFFGERAQPRQPAAYDTNLMNKAPKLKPASLRRIKAFAGLSDEHLGRFLDYIEVKESKQFSQIVHQGEPGDAMYFILQGEVRVRMVIAGKESSLAILSGGDFFGEIALFDHGARSADVVANEDSILLRIPAAAFEKMVHEAPNLAAPFLLGMGKTLTTRIRADNKRFSDSVSFSRMASAVRD
jgi:CRP-like cAMP-binding protein